MSSPLILTLLAGSATFIGAIFGVIGQKPSNRLLGFSLGFAAGIMLLISLMEMLPAALAAEGMSSINWVWTLIRLIIRILGVMDMQMVMERLITMDIQSRS